jgi:hypothetical protein
MLKKDYIIDFERVNQLTSSIYDDPNDKSSPFSTGKFAFSVSRKIISNYLEQFSSIHIKTKIDDKILHVIETLEYNGILVSKSTLRDNKINKILENENEN